MNRCGGDPVSRSLTHVRTAPRAQVVEKMALGGLAAVISREPAEQVLWWLGTFLSIGVSRVEVWILLGSPRSQRRAVWIRSRFRYVSLLAAYLMGVLQGADQ